MTHLKGVAKYAECLLFRTCPFIRIVILNATHPYKAKTIVIIFHPCPWRDELSTLSYLLSGNRSDLVLSRVYLQYFVMFVGV